MTPSNEPMRILIADDNRGVRDMTKASLNATGGPDLMQALRVQDREASAC